MAMVSARVPDELRSRAIERLEESGRTVTDLVVAAFDYVAATGELPRSGLGAKGSTPGERVLHGDNLLTFARSVSATTFPGAANGLDDDYKRLVAEGRRRDYEALS